MLTKEAIERVSALWGEPGWPEEIATPFAKAKHRAPFSYYMTRVRHLGIAGRMLVDAGCGSGTWAFAFASRFDTVLGFDFTADRLATARWLRDRFELSQVNFAPGDIRAMPVEDGAADAVYCNSVAFGEVSLKEIFTESFRVLRPGGARYIGLNGLGYAYSLLSDADPARRTKGEWTIYNSLCQTRLSPLIRRMAPGGWLNWAVRPGLAMARSPARFLATIGADKARVAAAAAIETDLGPAFAKVLADDLLAIAAGKQRVFSNPTLGRGYEPGELQAIAKEVGYDRFEWALDGCLSLGADGVGPRDPRPASGPRPGNTRVAFGCSKP
ncbi:MAG: class I SAM-dependent methyltransferase [Caulobacteraceae bacterium]